MVLDFLILAIGILFLLVKLVPEHNANKQWDRRKKRMDRETEFIKNKIKPYTDGDRLRKIVRMQTEKRYEELYRIATPAFEEINQLFNVELDWYAWIIMSFCPAIILGMDHKIRSLDAEFGFDFFYYSSEQQIENAFYLMRWLNGKMKEVGFEEMSFVPLKHGFNVKVYTGQPVSVSSMDSPQYGVYYWDSLLLPYIKDRIKRNEYSYLLD